MRRSTHRVDPDELEGGPRPAQRDAVDLLEPLRLDGRKWLITSEMVIKGRYTTIRGDKEPYVKSTVHASQDAQAGGEGTVLEQESLMCRCCYPHLQGQGDHGDVVGGTAEVIRAIKQQAEVIRAISSDYSPCICLTLKGRVIMVMWSGKRPTSSWKRQIEKRRFSHESLRARPRQACFVRGSVFRDRRWFKVSAGVVYI